MVQQEQHDPPPLAKEEEDETDLQGDEAEREYRGFEVSFEGGSRTSAEKERGVEGQMKSQKEEGEEGGMAESVATTKSSSAFATTASERESKGDVNRNGNDDPINEEDLHNKDDEDANPRNNGENCCTSCLDMENPETYCGAWVSCTRSVRRVLLVAMLSMSRVAATRPWFTIAFVLILSGTLATAGFLTNYYFETLNGNVWSPLDTISRDAGHYLYHNSSFLADPLPLDFLIHKNGSSVLEAEGIERVFQVQDRVAALERYNYLCEEASKFWFLGHCHIYSVADFWNESYDAFQQEVLLDESSSDQDSIVASTISAAKYPTGLNVDRTQILGSYKSTTQDNGNELITYAASFLIRFDVPRQNHTSKPTRQFIRDAIDYMLEVKYEWEYDPNNEYRLEIFSYEAFSRGLNDAILEDLPFAPSVTFVICLFTAAVFAKCGNPVQSRSLLGCGAVLTIVCAILTGFGLMFAAGVKVTTTTTMLPFLMLGIGLDDAFVLFGSYCRKDPNVDPVERVRLTIQDIGVSIFLTTLTSALAFSLGAFSQIPSIRWVCIYASVTITIDFIYQITFFVSLVVLDERRIKAGRSDCLICWKPQDGKGESETNNHSSNKVDDNEEGETNNHSNNKDDDNEAGMQILSPMDSAELDKHASPVVDTPTSNHEKHLADRIMGGYADILLTPVFQCFAQILFAALFAWSIYNTIHLHQEFSWVATLPQDSHFTDYVDAVDQFASQEDGIVSYAWFRYVDFSDVNVQVEIEEYVQSLYMEGPFIAPTNFWLRDFLSFLDSSSNSTSFSAGNNVTLSDMTFDEQIAAFLSIPGWYDAYRYSLALKDDKLIAARCMLRLPIDLQDAQEGIKMLETVRSIDWSTPINQNLLPSHWAFYTYAHEYQQWEFFTTVALEMRTMTIVGVAVITVVVYIFIPHWTATLFVFPFISLLYLDMLAWLNFTQVHVSPVSYIILLFSIGLMVDYIMHVLMRYYDSKGTRRERVKETLSTIGASVLLGAFTTFLGVVLLVFSTSTIIQSVFICVLGLVVFGVLHGLVFLPVLLSFVGPE